MGQRKADKLWPRPRATRHVWVVQPGNHGQPVPGVVVCWQHSPVHTVTTSEWVAMVVAAPFGTAMTLSWVGAERLLPIRDSSPTDGPG